MREGVQAAFRSILDLVFPNFCHFCGESLEGMIPVVCSSCAERIIPGEPRIREVEISLGKSDRFGLTLNALGDYEGDYRDLIHYYKFNGRRRLVDLFTARIQLKVNSPIFVPVPSSHSLLERPFDSAEVFARALAARYRGRVQSPFRWKAGTAAQSSLPARERLVNKKDRLKLSIFERMRSNLGERLGKSEVWIVDDVTTTGATVSEMTRKLLKLGVQPKGAVFLGITPGPGGLFGE